MENEMKYIKLNLKINGFPKKTVEKQNSKLKRKNSAGNFEQKSRNDEQKVSERLQRTLKPYDITLSNNSSSSISS